VFSNGLSIPGGAADPRNNVESVFLPPGIDGRFAVRVVGTTIAGDGVPGAGDATDQDFALVVSNADEQASPVLVHEDSSVQDGDGDGALEPGEPFSLSERLRNAGDDAATGVSGTLIGAGLTFTEPSSAWDDLEAGATGAGDAPFAGRLSSGASCGADAEATLSLSSDQGAQAVPLTLPTGEPQSPVVVPSTHSPALPIPDDNAAGTASTLQVLNPGRVKDLNVRINGITHGHVGDLRIDLTGPDGTTVRLLDHPGGPDNGGDNLTGTVFDDEAATSISSGSAPYSGRFRPQNDQLSRFDGKPRQGAWTLRVRDLSEVNTGTLGGWGTETQSAACDFGGAGPETRIDSGPPNPSATRDATFGFSSNASGARFECKLDAADYAECGSPQGYSGLADGPHTLSVRAVGADGNVDKTPASFSWLVSVPPGTAAGGAPPVTGGADTTAPNFALAPTEAHLADSLARGLPVLAGCASACNASATLTIPARTARRLGLRLHRTLATTRARLEAGRPRALKLRLSRAARAALHDETSVRATLAFRLSGEGRTLLLPQPVTLTRAAGLRRIASRGLRLGGICSERCSLSGSLSLRRREARGIGLRAPGSGPITMAQGAARASSSRISLTLRVASSHRRALSRVRRALKPTLETLVRGATGPGERASLRLLLRR
jgi:subtilisin-like proprotein convertase family protein